MLVGVGCKCMAMLAKGLKKKFQPFAANCLPALLEKFKEKKQNVVVPLRDAVDAIFDSVSIINANYISGKNPGLIKCLYKIYIGT